MGPASNSRIDASAAFSFSSSANPIETHLAVCLASIYALTPALHFLPALSRKEACMQPAASRQSMRIRRRRELNVRAPEDADGDKDEDNDNDVDADVDDIWLPTTVSWGGDALASEAPSPATRRGTVH